MKIFNYQKFAAALAKTQMSVREIAGFSGISPATAQRAKTGEHKLEIDTVISLCDMLSRPITDFIISKPRKK